MLQVIDDFLWTLRREGFTISPAQALDVVRAVREVGFADPLVVRDAIGCIVVDRASMLAQFRTQFAAFFTVTPEPLRDLDHRLRARGFSDEELRALHDLLEAFLSEEGGGVLGRLLAGDASLDHLLASQAVLRWLGRVASPAQAGFYAHRVFDELGLDKARSALAVVRDGLVDALGHRRGSALTAALSDEVSRVERRVRDTVTRRAALAEQAEMASGDARAVPFAALTPAQAEEVRRAVQALSQKLMGASRVRRRHARRGRIDPAGTARLMFRTGGVPFLPVRRDQRRDKPRIVLLCDVSDSVRAASRFMLEFVLAVRELFAQTRAFVFVNDVSEVTARLGRSSIDAVLLQASALGASGISSYGRVFQSFERRFADALDRRTTLLVLGDGRTNHLPDGAAALARLRERAKDVLWLASEPRSRWGQGDSALPRYAAHVSQVLEAGTAEGLEKAARQLLRRTR